MAEKFVVVWGRDDNTQRLIPVDDQYYADTVEAAKEAARELLPKAREPKLAPQEVLSIDDAKFQSMLEGTTPLHTFNTDTSLEFEMLEIRP